MDDFVLTVFFVILMLTLFWMEYQLGRIVRELERLRRDLHFIKIDEREK